MENKTSKIYTVTFLYGFIVILSNIFGVLLPNIFLGNEISLGNMDGWLQFLSDHKVATDIPQYFTFLLPTVLCFIYSYSNQSIESKIIKIPLAYSTIGITGWIFYLIEELIFLVIAINLGYDINVPNVLYVSVANIAMESTVTFTLAYFTTETINRKFILPNLFTTGHISQIKDAKTPSIRLLFFIYYFSVTLFPLVFLFSRYFASFFLNNEKDDVGFCTVLLIIIIIGWVITLSFINYIDKPMKILKNRIRKIEEGTYKTKDYIVTNDSFGELSDIINDMNDSIQEKTQKILDIQNSIITGMAAMVESRDNSTGGHIMRTSDCVRVFVEKLKEHPDYSDLSESFYEAVIKAAPMHDLGKIAVDDAILRKPGKFTDEEYEKMKIHPAEGAKIVEKVLTSVEDKEFKQITKNVAHYHHEKWNGQGYPSGISGENIPLEARIMALADVFDALVSKRCYKDSFTYDKAFEIIQDSLGSHFDPKLGAEFIKCRPELEKLYSLYN